MKFVRFTTCKSRKPAEVLFVPFWEGKEKPVSANLPLSKDLKLDISLECRDFSAKESEVLFSYQKSLSESRCALVGLGNKQSVSMESIRKAYSAALQEAQKKKLKTVNLFVPSVSSLSEREVVCAVAEGVALSAYCFHMKKKKDTAVVQKVGLVGVSPQGFKEAEKRATVAEAVHFSRDLVNRNADDVTPQALAACAKEIAKKHKKVHVTVFDKKQLEKEKMNLLLAVNRGSDKDPVLIVLEYKGASRKQDHTVVVGKGVTYDTGGLNLKPTGSMEDMKSDMGGAATALGCLVAAASLELPVNLTAVIPATENAIGPKSYKPGDVYSSYSGKQVEIGNTDAEGRLILADALAYAVKCLKPSRVIDFATLTGAMVICLGEEVTGFMSNDDALARALFQAGETTFERVWRLPVYPEYRKLLKSEIADIRNIGGRAGGAITAALFLKEFVGEIPWAHFDIAGTAYLSKARSYHPKYATGVGVRLITEFLESLV